jgi:hypothetical protein
MAGQPGNPAMPFPSGSAKGLKKSCWAKTCGGMRKARHCGQDRVGWAFTLTAAAYNLVRLPKLLAV